MLSNVDTDGHVSMVGGGGGRRLLAGNNALGTI